MPEKRRLTGSGNAWSRLAVLILTLSALLTAFWLRDDAKGIIVKGAAQASFADDPDAIERAAASVVKLDVYDRYGDRIATGSGFAAYSPAVLITAAHVIVNMEEMVATSDSGETVPVGDLIYANKDTDLAVFELPADCGLTPLPCAEEYPRRGEKAVAIGSQFGCINLVTMGNVCGIWNTGKDDWILFTAPVSGGNSGGPVFDGEGRVIGFVSGTYDKRQNMNLAVPIKKAGIIAGQVADWYEEESREESSR